MRKATLKQLEKKAEESALQQAQKIKELQQLFMDRDRLKNVIQPELDKQKKELQEILRQKKEHQEKTKKKINKKSREITKINKEIAKLARKTRTTKREYEKALQESKKKEQKKLINEAVSEKSLEALSRLYKY